MIGHRFNMDIFYKSGRCSNNPLADPNHNRLGSLGSQGKPSTSWEEVPCHVWPKKQLAIWIQNLPKPAGEHGMGNVIRFSEKPVYPTKHGWRFLIFLNGNWSLMALESLVRLCHYVPLQTGTNRSAWVLQIKIG